MKLAEFIQMTSMHQRQSMRAMLVWIISWMSCAFTYLAFMERVRTHLADRFGPLATELMAIAPMLIILSGAFIAGWLLSKKMEKQNPIKCPQCEKDLSAPMVAMVVIGSRNCAYCGKRVITEESPA